MSCKNLSWKRVVYFCVYRICLFAYHSDHCLFIYKIEVIPSVCRLFVL